jgi:hypothetical protein
VQPRAFGIREPLEGVGQRGAIAQTGRHVTRRVPLGQRYEQNAEYDRHW